MITRIVFCKGEWLCNATQSVDYWLTAMYCEIIAENKMPQRHMRQAVNCVNIIYIYIYTVCLLKLKRLYFCR